jgi:hypothetical protein
VKKILSFVLLFATLFNLKANIPVEDFLNQTDGFLRKYTKNGRVDYKALKKDPAELDNLVNVIEALNVAGLPAGNLQKSFWINTYNILVIKGIVANYPMESPLDIEGFFESVKHNAAQKQLTLDEIENQYLREAYQDGRIHFALVCAALGCPPLLSEAYRPEILDSQLDKHAKTTLKSDAFIRLNWQEKEVLISEIFNWYKGDFEKDGKTILEYINQFREEKIPSDFAIGYYPYDWKLNEL